MRSYGSVPPWLSNAIAPRIASASGIGASSGGGASVQTSDGQGFGDIVCKIGKTPSTSGSIVLNFASAPPLLFFGPSEEFGTVTVAGQTTTAITINFSGAKFVPGSIVNITYEWAVSK